MDPVTMILVAMAAGAAGGVGDTASAAVKDAYDGLKALLKRRFAGDANAEETLAEYEADPDTYEKPLAKQVKAAGADRDEQIKQSAEALLKLANVEGVRTKYHVQVQGGKVGIIGDHVSINTLNM